METLVIYFGGNTPAKARGKNQCNLLRFAFDNPGLHSYNPKCRATKRAIINLVDKQILIHYPETTQFQFNPNFGK